MLLVCGPELLQRQPARHLGSLSVGACLHPASLTPEQNQRPLLTSADVRKHWGNQGSGRSTQCCHQLILQTSLEHGTKPGPRRLPDSPSVTPTRCTRRGRSILPRAWPCWAVTSSWSHFPVSAPQRAFVPPPHLPPSSFLLFLSFLLPRVHRGQDEDVLDRGGPALRSCP